MIMIMIMIIVIVIVIVIVIIIIIIIIIIKIIIIITYISYLGLRVFTIVNRLRSHAHRSPVISLQSCFATSRFVASRSHTCKVDLLQ